MIELRHLRKEYPNSVPLKDVNTVIKKGDIIAVIGPSGTGKSTLLRCINLLCTPTSGQIIIDGEDITSPRYDIDKMRRKIGMVFQSFNLYQHLSVVENIMLAQTKLLKIGRQKAYDKAMMLLDRVGLARCAYHYPCQLSGGQQQRVAIARTLAADPEIILFDEPTSALDPIMVSEVEYVINDLAKEGRTMLIVTHEIDFAKKISNRIFYMDEGGIYEDGTPEQIFNNPQKERTKNFIFRLSNLDILVHSQDFLLDRAMADIMKFCDRHQLSHADITRIQIVFEEECINYLRENMKPGEIIDVKISFAQNNSKISIKINHNVKSVLSGSVEPDIFSRKIVSSYTSDIVRIPLRNEAYGEAEEILLTINRREN